MTKIAIIIPFRDRGIDPLRQKNMSRILTHWSNYGHQVLQVTDGGAGSDQFNRSAAYNIGAKMTDADILVYTESDMIISFDQIDQGVSLASQCHGLVVPFTQYRYLSAEDSYRVRENYDIDLMTISPETTMEDGTSIGAVNIVSRQTLDSVGQWDEGFRGNWYDDNAMKKAFEVTAGPTRWVQGPAFHLYHLPGWTGNHLTDEDRRATEANRQRYSLYEQANTPEQIRNLTTGLR